MCGRGFAVRTVAGLSGGGHAGAYAIRPIKDKEDHCKPIFAALFVGCFSGLQLRVFAALQAVAAAADFASSLLATAALSKD